MKLIVLLIKSLKICKLKEQKKKDKKAAKKAEQDAAKREKEIKVQKKLIEVFNDKKRKPLLKKMLLPSLSSG